MIGTGHEFEEYTKCNTVAIQLRRQNEMQLARRWLALADRIGGDKLFAIFVETDQPLTELIAELEQPGEIEPPAHDRIGRRQEAECE